MRLEEAGYALCTGLRDDVTETLDDYETELRAMSARAMPMVCANPDIVIHRGESLIYCAGALAGRYEAIGGDVVYAGKPCAPIYRRALALAQKSRGGPIDERRVLAVGDGMKTDIAGAVAGGVGHAARHARDSSERAARRGVGRAGERREDQPALPGVSDFGQSRRSARWRDDGAEIRQAFGNPN